MSIIWVTPVFDILLIMTWMAKDTTENSGKYACSQHNYTIRQILSPHMSVLSKSVWQWVSILLMVLLCSNTLTQYAPRVCKQVNRPTRNWNYEVFDISCRDIVAPWCLVCVGITPVRTIAQGHTYMLHLCITTLHIRFTLVQTFNIDGI